MEHQFDALAKALAEGVSRREALRRLGSGLARVLLVSLGLRKAWSQSARDCQSYCRGHITSQYPQGAFGRCVSSCQECVSHGDILCSVSSSGSVICCTRRQGQDCCAGVCTPLDTNRDCGACNNACGSQENCCGGKRCIPEEASCCVDRAGNVGFCSGATPLCCLQERYCCPELFPKCCPGRVCAAPDANCCPGSNDGACSAKETCCRPGRGSSYCADLRYDEGNCGRCRKTCAGGLFCIEGVCAPCPEDRRCNFDGACCPPPFSFGQSSDGPCTCVATSSRSASIGVDWS